MRRLTLVTTALTGLAVGAALFSSRPAAAAWPTTDVIAHFLTQQLQRAMERVITNVENAVTNIGTNIVDRITNLDTSINDIMSRGFSQVTNYTRAAVGAQQQIADAQNTANAIFLRDQRSAEIRDQHVVNPNLCAALDGGVATAAAGVGGYGVMTSISEIMDLRGTAGPGTPSYNGAAQGAASIAQLHLRNYCNQMDADARLCAARSATADHDQRAISLWSGGTYADQTAIDTAKDFQTLLIQPVAPAAIRGDQLASVEGQEAAVRRRSYNARMSLAHYYVARSIAAQAPSVDVSPEQQRVMTDRGLAPGPQASWLQLLQIESERRIGDVSWNAFLAAAPPTTVQREIAVQQALTNFLLFQLLQDGMQRGAIAATHLAQQVDRDFEPGSRMPAPNIN
jgi:hypothetical protein